MNHAQNKLRANVLTMRYTYVSLEIRHVIVCTSTPDGHVRTYWKHHITLAYLAATDRRWKEIMTEKLQEMDSNCMRYSSGGIMTDQYRWMERARSCIYYRRNQKYGEDSTQRTWTLTAIANYDWETAQPLATSEPQKLTATKIWEHPNGDSMTDEEIIHSQFRQAREERIHSVTTERTLLHSDLSRDSDARLNAFTTDNTDESCNLSTVSCWSQ